MAVKPTEEYRWAYEQGANIEVPDSLRLQQGWQLNNIPPSAWQNYNMNAQGKWIGYLEETTDDHETRISTNEGDIATLQSNVADITQFRTEDLTVGWGTVNDLIGSGGFPDVSYLAADASSSKEFGIKTGYDTVTYYLNDAISAQSPDLDTYNCLLLLINPTSPTPDVANGTSVTFNPRFSVPVSASYNCVYAGNVTNWGGKGGFVIHQQELHTFNALVTWFGTSLIAPRL